MDLVANLWSHPTMMILDQHRDDRDNTGARIIRGDDRHDVAALGAFWVPCFPFPLLPLACVHMYSTCSCCIVLYRQTYRDRDREAERHREAHAVALYTDRQMTDRERH